MLDLKSIEIFISALNSWTTKAVVPYLGNYEQKLAFPVEV